MKKQKDKELAVKSQKLTELQTKYDLEVRPKEDLIKDLNFYSYHASSFLLKLN
jgi:hypothetical protein